jgi:hypothetical protein
MSFPKPYSKESSTRNSQGSLQSQNISQTDEESNFYSKNENTKITRLPLSHYLSNKNNLSKNYYELDMVIIRAMTTPGTDASRNLKKKYSKDIKDFENCIGQAAQMIELTGKALTTNLIVFNYKLDISKQEGINKLKKHMLELFQSKNPNLSTSMITQIKKWLESVYFTSDYLKYYRETRLDITKSWIKTYFEKPSEWIRNALDGVVYKCSKSNIIYPSIESAENSRISSRFEAEDNKLSIFGMIGL